MAVTDTYIGLGGQLLYKGRGSKGEATGCFRRAKKICANSLAGEDRGLGSIKAEAIMDSGNKGEGQAAFQISEKMHIGALSPY